MATILIIEANHTLRAAVVAILELAGYTTLSAADGPSGITLAFEHRPDIVLCEAKTPKLNGLGVLVVLRTNPTTATTPFFLMASHLSKSDLSKGLDNGASGFLIKPFTESELLLKLQTRLDQ